MGEGQWGHEASTPPTLGALAGKSTLEGSGEWPHLGSGRWLQGRG